MNLLMIQDYSLVILASVIAAIIFIVLKSIIVVDGREIAVLERRWFGKKMPQGRVIAMTGEIGIQAKTLGPGLHLVIPFIFTAKKIRFTVIRENEVGIVEAIDGNPVQQGKIFAQSVQGCNAFQDGELFLKNGGEKGPQIDILPPGNYRINTTLFIVRNEPVLVIEKGKVGLVTAMDGNPIVPGRLLAHFVEGHKNF
jgi:uncharacterized membrane protein YqiK